LAKSPDITFDRLLTALQEVPEAEVQGWADVDRVDVRPKDGIAKVTCKNRYEVQVDFKTAEVLQVAYRRSDLIEAMHDGSWFHDAAKLWVFLPAAVVLLGLWVSGLILFAHPWWVKLRRKRAKPGGPGA
ncbi:MAG: PepSY domain-containing protein, partial [Fimbriiglobus sp.]|nr:PepSY domain-containing protein [Fimbriiglobus sp.]